MPPFTKALYLWRKMSKFLNSTAFIDAFDVPGRLLLDARSPKEYNHAHIPGAINLPLLNDENREKVGITYKKEGREAAVIKGFELVGPQFADMIRQVKTLGDGKELLIYCWRGGMRSGILSWLLGMSGFTVRLLDGGYKSYRNMVLNSLLEQRKIIILGGKTGSGKSELLNHLHNKGEQILDLEKLAEHKGSSFGALGQSAQPSNEHFENLLFNDLRKLNIEKPLWIENESRSIGSVKIPDSLFNQMRDAFVVEIDVPIDIRKKRILHEYGDFPVEQLKKCTERLEKRLGGLRLQLCLSALEEGRMDEWLDYLLEYYDETYAYGMSLRDKLKRTSLELNHSESFADFAEKLKDNKPQIVLNNTV
ncbi:MAG: tRNA 2-selenouridine(34) synthase MnmH [Bacteroidetes bacterium]|nr:MAG: tRNA 2-selenouridine(34) synthase MnmH [Bacteroidota bacterium]